MKMKFLVVGIGVLILLFSVDVGVGIAVAAEEGTSSDSSKVSFEINSQLDNRLKKIEAKLSDENYSVFSIISPVAKIICLAIGAATLLISLIILRGFFERGVSFALAEIMIRNYENDPEKVEKIARWFGNGKEVSEYLRRISVKLGAEKGKS